MPLLQDKLAKALYKMQNRLQSFNVQIKGTEVDCLMIRVIEDKYGNTEQNILYTTDLQMVIDFPMDDIPTSLSSNQENNDDSNMILHAWELLPITAYLKNTTLAQLGSGIKGAIILYKLKNINGDFQVIPFQVLSANQKGNPNAILVTELQLAPVTDFAIANTEEYKQILETFKNKNVW